jgi:5-methyltetrahydropteroyltriglutamate--homocysteine methyltransferase
MRPPNPQIFFDDVGSFPKPQGFNPRNANLDENYARVIRDTMAQKVSTGLEVPTYPQYRDMVGMFMGLISSPDTSESPYLVKRDLARIFELDALKEPCAKRPVRASVTGPIELYLSAFGSTAYEDILFNMAESVARFLEVALETGMVKVASIDEPSLGISSSVIFNEDQIAKALEIASRPCLRTDCEVHLHSPLYAELCCCVPYINIVGVESAGHPDYLRLIDKKMLEENDSYIRVGIARTDILSLVARLNESMGRNLWEDPAALEREVLKAESVEVIQKRLSKAYSIMGDRIRCAGPDCGLGSWPSQGMARDLLSNCARAISGFKESSGEQF